MKTIKSALIIAGLSISLAAFHFLTTSTPQELGSEWTSKHSGQYNHRMERNAASFCNTTLNKEGYKVQTCFGFI